MKIGVILHSQTGNTHEVGQKIKERLESNGHQVTLSRMKTLNASNASQKEIQLDCTPETGAYDALIFGGWVQGFALCPGMSLYLNQLSSLATKKTACFITEHFPYPWMGGRSAMSKMTRILTAKGAVVVASGIINWSKKSGHENQIEALVEHISKQYDERPQ